MAQNSGFFNALYSEGTYDRKYNAEDYSENLAVVIGNGVLRSEQDDLKVTGNGMAVSVGVGRGWIKGRWYYNDSTYYFNSVLPPTGGSRYDRVMLRFDNNISGRKISLEYVQGTPSNTPVKPSPTRNESIYELVLADVYVGANATSVVVTDTRSDNTICGWVYSVVGDNSFFTTLDNSFYSWFSRVRDNLASVTLFKRYSWIYTLTAASRTVNFDIPQYDADTSFIEVYVNGVLDTPNINYSIQGTVITFTGTLTAGTRVVVNCYKSIDGTGIMSVADEITELQNEVATLSGVSKYTYKCTGLNDNISLSQIAEAFYTGSYVSSAVTEAARAFLTAIGGNTYLASLSADCQVTIDVVGTCGVGAPYAGDGSANSRFRYFSLGSASVGEKRIIFDFAKCTKISLQCPANTSNIGIYGTDLFIKNIHLEAKKSAVGTNIELFAGSTKTGRVEIDNSKLKIAASGTAVISKQGTFTNCRCYVTSTGGNAYCFDAVSASFIRLIGGTYFAYASSGYKSAPFNIDAAQTNAVISAYNISCPTVAETSLTQAYLAYGASGKIYLNGVISTLTASGSAVSIVGQIQQSKP